MKLFTHNLLLCNKKGCTVNDYPLKIIPKRIITKENLLDTDNIERFLRKVDWKGLESACNDIGQPLKVKYDELTAEQKKSKEFYEYINTVLFETVIFEGTLKCPHCEREYPIENGVYNIMMKDDEI